MLQFLARLPVLFRNKYVVCMITIPAYMHSVKSGVTGCNSFVRRVEHLCDAVLELESFAGSCLPTEQPYVSDYSGLLHPNKLFCTNSNTTTTRFSQLQLHSLGFKVRRKRFSIETFHLPPEDAPDDGNEKNTMGCSSSLSTATNSLDF